MFEFLQTFNRVALAFLSGALLIVGTTFGADLLMGRASPHDSAFHQVAGMLTREPFNIIFAVITILTAYAIGVINFAASCVVFRRLGKRTQNELLLVSQIESLEQPQVLKEFLELLHVKRALLAFTFPLTYFGIALACDIREDSFGHTVRIAAGAALAGLAILAWGFATRMTLLLETTASKLLADAPNKARNSTN